MKDHLIVQGVKLILQGLEVNTNDRNYIKTPHRVLDAYKEMFTRRTEFPPVFEEKYDEMVVMRHHTAWTLCPHHLLPVLLDISVGYVPNGGVVGLSKLARIAEMHLTGPILQETATNGIADDLINRISPPPLGAGVVIEGEHLCMKMRGLRTSGKVTTSAMRGSLLNKPETRAEFLALVRNSPSR